MKWEMSILPKQTAEETEAARWSLVTENDVGLYAYDMSSLTFGKAEAGGEDHSRVCVAVKSIFTNEKILKKLQKEYAAKLEDKEKVLYCLMELEYKMETLQYRVNTMQVYTNTNRLIEEKPATDFVAVPQGTFAEAMLNVCRTFREDALTDTGRNPA